MGENFVGHLSAGGSISTVSTQGHFVLECRP